MERERCVRVGLSALGILVALVGLFLAGLPLSGIDPQALRFRQRASAALASGKVAEAEELAGRLLGLGVCPEALILLGEVRLTRLDPVGARRAYSEALRLAPGDREARLGLAAAFLELLQPEEALLLAREVRIEVAREPRAWALEIRCLLDLGLASQALALSEASQAWFPEPPAELLAARGAALFRARRIPEAAQAYRDALAREPLLLEAHLRLGGGLVPCKAPAGRGLVPGMLELERDQPLEAIALLGGALRNRGSDPTLHRLLGEALQAARLQESFLGSHPVTARLAAQLPDPGAGSIALERLFADYPALAPERQAQVHVAAALWASYLPGLIRAGGRHDLLTHTQRATDAVERTRLRGRTTADGRHWEHVRGLGGLHAATGVEALDQARRFGFHTLVHELTHQVHIYVMDPATRARVEALFQEALRHGRCLDYYAATCAEEYLAQGAEAFVSLAKRPDSRRTHSHTRFELIALDPALEEFLRRHASWDPLAGPGRSALLEAAAEYALLAGRPGEALTALGLLGAELSAHAADLRDQARLEFAGGVQVGP